MQSIFMSMKNGARLIEIICTLFVILFIYTATSKLIDIQKFSIELGKSPLLTNFALLVAILIPVSGNRHIDYAEFRKNTIIRSLRIVFHDDKVSLVI